MNKFIAGALASAACAVIAFFVIEELKKRGFSL